MSATTARRPGCRPAFTLLELLVVMSIIVVLAALAAGASFKVVEVQNQSNTETTIRTIAGVLREQWNAVIDQAKSELIPTDVVTQLANNDPRVAKVIWVKLRLKQEFPMTFDEALNPSAASNPSMPSSTSFNYLDGKPSYKKQLSQANINGSPPDPQNKQKAYEMATCLYMSLNGQGRRGMVTDLDTGVGRNSVAGSPLASGMKMFVDGWGNPIVMARNPTQNQDLNPTAAWQSSGTRDVQDPEGLLTSPAWTGWAGPSGGQPAVTSFQQILHELATQAQPPPPPPPPFQSYYLEPVVASFGPSFRAGTTALPITPFNMAPVSAGSDNGAIYSFRLRQGARGD
jgi:prepilin-type N-terminal cleavage/methylation domain-containing protein